MYMYIYGGGPLIGINTFLLYANYFQSNCRCSSNNSLINVNYQLLNSPNASPARLFSKCMAQLVRVLGLHTEAWRFIRWVGSWAPDLR